MVKHQRRSHQRGAHSSEPDDGETSESDSGDSPSTPQHSGQGVWSQNIQAPTHHVISNGHHVHRARSFADFGHHQVEGFPIQHNFGQRHSLSNGPQNYNSTVQEQANHNPIIHRAPSLPAQASYYVPEQNNPGVATLTPIQTYQIPRQPMERQETVQSSPSSYSSVSRASPVSQEPYYTHHPAQAATYALQHTAPNEQQPMIQYQQQLPQHLSQAQGHPIPTPGPQTGHVQGQYHQAVPQDGQWYEGLPYQPPVEVISHIQAYPQVHAFQDPWVQKIEAFEDQSLQMPSARIETL